MSKRVNNKWERRKQLEECIQRAIYQRAGMAAEQPGGTARAQQIATLARELDWSIAEALLREYRVSRRARGERVVG